MCGIAGLYRRDGRVDFGRLKRMSQVLRHRGPDDEGLLLADPRGATLALGGPDTPRAVFESALPYAPGRQQGPVEYDYRLGLVHRRLAIVDLSPGGHGPMCDRERRAWIAFNGEIYNHVELRQALEAQGDRFVTTSDVEVLLAAYRRYGRRCLELLNGMFAFAIWDADRRELFCVRDRLGVKPLYYQWDGNAFAFASEPKALVLTQPQRVRARLEAVRDLLALDWVDHEAHTFFEDLWQLPAGHWLAVGERGMEIRRWWTLEPRHPGGTRADREQAFGELFTDAVRLRLRADVEVGSCLSGGLDSSAVVTTAASLMDKPIHAFTCAYDEGPAYDERPYVRAVVERTGAVSHVVVPTGGDFWPVFDRLVEVQDEPTAGPGLYSQWKVMELAHQSGLKVLLDGQGGDETLAGYFRYLPPRLRDLLAAGRLGAFLALFGPVAARLGATTTLALTLEPWLPAGVVAPLRRRYGAGKERLLGDRLRRITGAGRVPSPPARFPTWLARQQAFDTLQRLLPSLLRYEDRNSMAFAIETRLPFLDYRLVEMAFSLPDEERLDGVTTKAILRRALSDRIPPAVLQRRDKMGFETPTDLWLRKRHAAELEKRLVATSPIHDWIDQRAVRGALDQFLSGRREMGLQIWRLLALESWARRFVLSDPRLGEPATELPPSIGRGRHALGGMRLPRPAPPYAATAT